MEQELSVPATAACGQVRAEELTVDPWAAMFFCRLEC
jgi:hypothetical protein